MRQSESGLNNKEIISLGISHSPDLQYDKNAIVRDEEVCKGPCQSS